MFVLSGRGLVWRQKTRGVSFKSFPVKTTKAKQFYPGYVKSS